MSSEFGVEVKPFCNSVTPAATGDFSRRTLIGGRFAWLKYVTE